MRSRTELVTHQLEGSEFEDESDFEDSEEDWRPAKGEQKPKKIKTSGRGRKSVGGSKNGSGTKRGRKPSRKAKKQSSSEEDLSDESEPESEPTPAKKPRKTAKKSTDSNVSADAYQSASDAPQPTETVVLKSEPTTSMFGNSTTAASPTPKPQPLQRKIVTPVKSFPDKCGYLNLFMFKGDLKDGIVNNAQLCLWRRDGSSLLQKYLRDKTVQSETPQFNSSMVYSCWEDKRANEYLEVKVRCLEQSKQIRVELTDLEELEAKSKEEYDSYVATYGTPVPRSGVTQQDDDDDEDCDEDELMDGAGGEEDGEDFDEDGEAEDVAQEE